MAKQTFESVNAHIEKHFSKLPKTAPKSVSIDKLKSVYVVVRPVLLLVSNFPFIPTKWKQAISTFITTLDLLTATV